MYVNRDHTYISFENPFSHHHVFSCNSSTHIQLMCVYVRLDSYCIHLFWRPFSHHHVFFCRFVSTHLHFLCVCILRLDHTYISFEDPFFFHICTSLFELYFFWRSFFVPHIHVSFSAISPLKVLFSPTYTRLFFSYTTHIGLVCRSAPEASWRGAFDPYNTL